MPDYVLHLGRHRLHLGQMVEEEASDGRAPEAAQESWDLPRRPLTARQIVEELDTLFQAVCLRLGAGTRDRRILLQSMAATLKTAGREASLPLQALAFADPLRREFTDQAFIIGETLADWSVAAGEAATAVQRLGPDRLRQIELRSHCEGHLWTEEATAILTGASGGPVVMQLYNEWLHQLVLLRDALLPFENWAEIPLPLHRRGEGLGLRSLEEARSAFLAEFLTRLLTHASIVRYARSLFGATDKRRDSDWYGFQAEGGLVLPSVIGREDLAAGSKGLLAWHPARIAGLPPGRMVGFRYGLADYLAAPRSGIGVVAGDPPPTGDGTILAEPAGEGEAVLWLDLSAGARSYRVELGQCLRGQRFAYRPHPGKEGASSRVDTHRAQEILVQPGLVTASEGKHIVPTGGHALVTLALLGKIYPENVVLGEAAPWSDVLAAGKGYGAQFVLGTPLDRLGS